MPRLALRAALIVMWSGCGAVPPPPALPPSVPFLVEPAPAPDRAAVALEAVPLPPRFTPTAFTVSVHGHGRPVILIPGLGCPGEVWAPTVAHLAQAHVETHVLTLAGFAGAPPIAQPLSATVRTQLAAYIRDRHLEHPVIIGHSLGGVIALWLAATEPDLVGPTIIVDTFPAHGADPGSYSSVLALAATWKAMSPADFAAAARDMFAAMATDELQIEPVIEDVLRSDRRAFADAFAELFRVDLRPLLPHVSAPVLMVLADGPFQDKIREQITAIPVHASVVLPHTRHFVMFDDPAGFYRAVDSFLAAHP